MYLVDSSHHKEAISDDDGGGGASGEGHGSQPLPLLSLRMKSLHCVQGRGFMTWRTNTRPKISYQRL